MRQFKFLLFGSLFLFLSVSGCTKNTYNSLPGQGQATPESQNEAKSKTSEAQGGVINGGGGRGVKCSLNGVTTVQVLDIYEAKALYDLETINLGNTQDASSSALSILIATHFWNPITIPISESAKMIKTETIQKYLDRIHFIHPGQHLKLTDDAHAPILESGCEDVQIATYYDESILLVDNELWSQLDWTNKMGLIAHEVFYQYARQFGATNSMSTRKLIGMLLSTKKPAPISEGVPPNENEYANCSLKQNGLWKGHFFMHEKMSRYNRKGMEFIFGGLPEGGVFFRTSAFFEDMEFMQLLFPKSHGTGNSEIEIDTYPKQDRILVTFDGTIGDEMNGKILIQSSSSARRSVAYDVTCDIPRDRSKIFPQLKVTPGEFRRVHSITDADLLSIQADGSIRIEETRQVGDRTSRGNRGKEIPYPTICRYIYNGIIFSQTNSKYRYIVQEVTIGDLTGLEDTEHCADYIQNQKDFAETGWLIYDVDLSRYDPTQ